MKPRKQLGAWLKAARAKRKIRSAAELSRRAGIALAHTASIERGAFCPTWRTAQLLASALQLDDRERTEFFHLVDSAAKPDSARAATAGLAIPNVCIWRHLPELLYHNVNHTDNSLLGEDPDATVQHVVPAVASLLTWAHTRGAVPADAERESLRAAAHAGFAASLERLGLQPADAPDRVRGLAVIDGARTMIRARRAQLFTSAPWTRQAVADLAQWEFWPPYRTRAGPRPSLLSVAFKRPTLDRQLSFQNVRTALTAEVHDALVAYHLWGALALHDALAPLPLDEYLALERLRKAAAWIMSHPPTTALSDTAFDAVHEARFALRLYELPDLAAAVLDHDPAELAARCQLHADALRQHNND